MTAAQENALDSAFAVLAEQFGEAVVIVQPNPLRTNLEIRKTGNAIAAASMCGAAHAWVMRDGDDDDGEEVEE